MRVGFCLIDALTKKSCGKYVCGVLYRVADGVGQMVSVVWLSVVWLSKC